MIFTIQNSKLTAAIDSMGAQLISLKDEAGKEYIWQRDPSVWSSCSPLLFPVVGNCRNGKTLFNGKWYDMPKHGICRSQDFAVTSQSDSAVTFTLKASKETKINYPYEFCLSLTYTLKEDSLHMDYHVENLSTLSMPFLLGSHPGFICPLDEGENFQDYCFEFEQEEDTTSMVYDLEKLEFDPLHRGYELRNTKILPLSYDLFKDDAIYFDNLRSRSVLLTHREQKKGVRVAYPGFSSVAFWTSYEPRADYVCIEPWNGSAIRTDEDDHLENRHGVQILEPGCDAHYGLEISIL